jgi:GNAT superfamily N-acetyltransferase
MPVHVRDATESDAAALSRLWFDLVSRPGGDTIGDAPEVVVAKAVLRFAEGDVGRIIVAEMDGSVVGCGFLRVGLVSPLDDGRVVNLSHVQVAPGFGRQGVGSALVEATLTWAEQRGIESMIAAVPANDREANRFLARLGMAPVASLRGGSVASLRARLPHAASAVVRQGGRAGRNVGQVVAARRSQRRARAREIAP